MRTTYLFDISEYGKSVLVLEWRIDNCIGRPQNARLDILKIFHDVERSVIKFDQYALTKTLEACLYCKVLKKNILHPNELILFLYQTSKYSLKSNVYFFPERLVINPYFQFF